MRSVATAPVVRLGVLGVVLGVSGLLVAACGSKGEPAPRGNGTSGGQGAALSGGVTGVSGDVGFGGTVSAGGAAGAASAGALGGSGAEPNLGAGGTAPPASGGSGGVELGGAPSAGASSASGGAAPVAGAGGGGMPACQMASYSFVPKTPTVIVMVDRSGSMFDCISEPSLQPSCKDKSDTPWEKLRIAVESVIESLQGQVRFGFATVTGTDPSAGGKCPELDSVPPDLNNYTKIQTKYDALEFQPETNQPGKKFESPASFVLQQVGMELAADTFPGDKYVLFLTDGQPDYCDDSNVLCAPDSVIMALQNLKKQNITTIVMGLQVDAEAIPIAPGVLQAYANAGAGEDTLAPVDASKGQDATALYDQCAGVAGWAADLVASGKTAERGVTLGTYAETAGPTKPYTPNVTDQSMLTAQLAAALSGVKSCSFDLSNVNGQSIKVDLNQLDQATVSVMGSMVPLDMTNGWSMGSATQLVLNGSACENWRKPEVKDIAFNFPCKAIIFE